MYRHRELGTQVGTASLHHHDEDDNDASVSDHGAARREHTDNDEQYSVCLPPAVRPQHSYNTRFREQHEQLLGSARKRGRANVAQCRRVRRSKRLESKLHQLERLAASVSASCKRRRSHTSYEKTSDDENIGTTGHDSNNDDDDVDDDDDDEHGEHSDQSSGSACTDDDEDDDDDEERFARASLLLHETLAASRAGTPTKECEFCMSEIPVAASRCRFCQANLEVTERMEGEGFVVMKRRRADAETGHATETVTIRVVDETLRKRLQRILRNEAALMHPHAELPLSTLFAARQELRDDPQCRQGTFMCELVNFLDAETRQLAAAFEEMRERGVVSFTMLPHAFPVGSRIYGTQDERPLGMTVTGAEIESGTFRSFFVLQGNVVYSDGQQFVTLAHRFAIPQFSGLKRLDALPVRYLSNEMHRRLAERGERFRRYALDHHHLEYRGAMLRRGGRSGGGGGGRKRGGGGQGGGSTATRGEATGRVMIDPAAMRRMQPNYAFTDAGYYFPDENDEDERERWIEDEQLFSTWPTLCGFSFRLKKWGEFYVDRLGPVQWDDAAFGRMVLPDTHRRLVSALVTQVAREEDADERGPRADIIAHKGRGCVLLLHGKPGTGKTSTAETVAEHLHRSLYVVSAGDLGTTADQLDRRLRAILDLSSVWKSIVLIDEVDAFLARRDSHDLARNAMVSIFLRLLEYHSGILFLTTNRIRDFDDAFFSRVHLALPYGPLDADGRRQVWRTMLDLTQMPYRDRTIGLEHLVNASINGRQIRTVVRVAAMLARQEESLTLRAEHFVLPLEHLQQFERDVQEQDNADNGNEAGESLFYSAMDTYDDVDYGAEDEGEEEETIRDNDVESESDDATSSASRDVDDDDDDDDYQEDA